MLQIALLAVLAAAPKATAADPAAGPVDLLDFDQGAVLLESPPSYSDGVAAWSAFRLADGDDRQGWCSAEGSPVGATFVYELETDAKLEKLRVHCAGAQESGYPGISVKSLELWGAGATGPFQKIGTFEVPKGADKEFPVPAGKPVRRVKLVVASNHGNPSYTEIMELDLLGTKIGPAPAQDVSGDYHSNQWSGLRMKQSGTHVDGCYDFNFGVFSGELEGRVARVTWREFSDDGKEAAKGTATFVVGPGKAWVRGVYFKGGELTGTWDLSPAKPDQVAKCKLPGGSMGDQLKKEGRLALYGIHFDANSDVPRADSEPTLKQLLEALQGDVSLRLRVEGHTDSTNTDAYNQGLSERRARAVAAWLTGRGIDKGRLEPAGYGRTRPVASNGTAQGRALNRRVEVALPGK